MSIFFEATWILWWLFALVVVGWCSWRMHATDEDGPYERPVPWRRIYSQALAEHDTGKAGIRIQQAEGAILLELATQVFASNSAEQKALHDAMNDLRGIRQSYSESPEKD